MLKAMMWSMLGLLMTASAARADFFYSPVGYYPAPVAVQPVYSAPIPVGVTYATVAPVVVARPVYVSPVVQTVYSAPITTYSTPVYSSPITTVSYASPVYASPVYVRPVTLAPVVTSVARQSLVVRPHTSTYRSSVHGWGSGYSLYEHSTPHRTVIRARGW